MFDLEAWKLFLPYHKKLEVIARWFIQCTGYMIPNGQQHSYTHHIIYSYQHGPWEQNCSNQIMNHQNYTFKSKSWKFAGPLSGTGKHIPSFWYHLTTHTHNTLAGSWMPVKLLWLDHSIQKYTCQFLMNGDILTAGLTFL